jgi:hypothetical protein
MASFFNKKPPGILFGLLIIVLIIVFLMNINNVSGFGETSPTQSAVDAVNAYVDSTILNKNLLAEQYRTQAASIDANTAYKKFVFETLGYVAYITPTMARAVASVKPDMNTVLINNADAADAAYKSAINNYKMATDTANLGKIAQNACKAANLTYVTLLNDSKTAKSVEIKKADSNFKSAQQLVTFANNDSDRIDQMYKYR